MKISVLILIITGVFVLTGCPSPASSEHYIEFNSEIFGGRIEVVDDDGNPIRQASRNTRITIKASPNPGNAVMEMEIRDTSLMHWVSETNVDLTTYTFVMPNHSVVIRATFGTFEQVLANDINRLAVTGSRNWGTINAVNNRLTAMQNLGYTPSSTLLNELAKIIREDIWVENMTSWVGGATWASWPIDYRQASATDIERTHVYFLLASPSDFPETTPPAGWDTVGTPTDHLFFGAPGIREINFAYPIGGPPLQTVQHILWLVPVAQYNVVWETTIRKDFEIQAFFTATPTVNASPPNNNVTGTSKLSWTCDVGANIFTRIWTRNPAQHTGTQIYTITDQAGATIANASPSDSAPFIEFVATSQIYTIRVSNQP
jgi:hypothetical protein